MKDMQVASEIKVSNINNLGNHKRNCTVDLSDLNAAITCGDRQTFIMPTSKFIQADLFPQDATTQLKVKGNTKVRTHAAFVSYVDEGNSRYKLQEYFSYLERYQTNTFI